MTKNTIISADMKTVPHDGSVNLAYGSASASDNDIDSSDIILHSYFTFGTNNLSNSAVAVYIKNSSGTIVVSNSTSGAGRKTSCMWEAGSYKSHTHSAGSSVIY